MPAGDGTGPMGAGPMTGWGMGYCAGYPAAGYDAPAVAVAGCVLDAGSAMAPGVAAATGGGTGTMPPVCPAGRGGDHPQPKPMDRPTRPRPARMKSKCSETKRNG
jgi:hypothetical protein